MKTFTLILSIFAICVIQGIFAEELMKCKSSCFEGCSFGICRQTPSCTGCSRKYYEDKQKAKTKIKLMKIRDEKKIESIKIRNEKEMDILVEKHESEMSELVMSHKSNYEHLVNSLNTQMKSIMHSQKVKLMEMRTNHFNEVKEMKQRHAKEVKSLRIEHKRTIKTTKVVLKGIFDKKEKELETICHGRHCPCCKSGFTLNCNVC